MDKPVVGVIGFGELGTVAGAALTRDGYRVLGLDPSPEARGRMADLGVEVAADPAQIGRECDAVVILVVTADQTRAVLDGPDGLFAAMPNGVVLLQSTVGPEISIEMDRASPAGVTFIDAPVTVRRGDPPTFFALVGARDALSPTIRTMLDSYCHEVAIIGPPGAGQAAKLANNVMSIVNTAAASEALRMAAAYGIEREAMLALARRGSGASQALMSWDHRREGLFEPGPGDPHRRSKARKDLSTAVRTAQSLGVEMPVTQSAIDQLKI